MTDIEMEKEVDQFRDELSKGVFKIERSTNTADDYSETKEDRDSNAFTEFLETDIFNEITLLDQK
ncbi:MAG: hypothetical protein LBF83_06515 [Spirochaetaceae bacterium]|jgi:hypothetical protein|nr:hypothetical protein [Spirochaetaceae bacterium]